MTNPLDLLNIPWRKKEEKKETPDQLGRTPWVRVGVILRAIPFQKLLPALVSVPVIVFLTISGFIAWLAVFARFAASMFNFGS